MNNISPAGVVAFQPPLAPELPAGKKRRWGRFGGKFLVLSVCTHLLFGLIAAYFIVQTVQANRKPIFQSGPKGPSAPTRALEHKVQMKKQNTRSAPPQAKRVTTTGISKVALPDMPAMPSLSAAVSPNAISGMGAAGLSPGGLSAGGGMGGNGGAAINFFGARGGGSGLTGTFYDFKMQQGYQPVKGMNQGAFAKVVHDFASLAGPWRADAKYPHYTSPAKLSSRYFIFPAIQDTEAATSFQSPKSGPGCWIAHYRGRFSSNVRGTFRFVGFGDNVMIVKVGDRVVLDASDHGYTGLKREAAGNVAFPRKGATPLFFGQWFDLSPGSPQNIEVAIGDEGGIFCAGLFVQEKDAPYAQGEHGIPKLPVFALGSLTVADRDLLGKSVPAECLQNPPFKAEAPAMTSALDSF